MRTFVLSIVLLLSAVVTVQFTPTAAGQVLATEHADLHAAVAALPDRGGEVYLPAGFYEIDRPLLLPDHVTLRGSGDATVIHAGHAFADTFADHTPNASTNDMALVFNTGHSFPAIIKNASDKGNRGIRVMDLRITNDRNAMPPTTGILLHNVQRSAIRGVTVEGCGGQGIALSQSRDIKITECYLENNHSGILIKGDGDATRDVLVSGCTIRENRWSGIYTSGSSAHGPDALINGPRNLVITANHVMDHMTDSGIKLHAAQDAIVTSNRIDRALESGIEANGTHGMVCANNFVTRIDDGMQLAGNGVGIYFGRQSRRADLAITGNVVAECQGGFWSEAAHAEGSQHHTGGFSIVGNMAARNVAFGIALAGVHDGVVVANAAIDNGQFDPPPGQDTSGMVLTAGSSRVQVLGNVMVNANTGEEKLMKNAMIIRNAADSTVTDNLLYGSYEQQLKALSPIPGVRFDNNFIPDPNDTTKTE